MLNNLPKWGLEPEGLEKKTGENPNLLFSGVAFGVAWLERLEFVLRLSEPKYSWIESDIESNSSLRRFLLVLSFSISSSSSATLNLEFFLS